MAVISSRLTDEFNPFNESPSHRKKSCEGFTGVSSILGVAATSFGAGCGRGDVAVALFNRAARDATALGADADGATGGRAGLAVVAVLPLDPTVVQAGAVCTAVLLFMVSAYALRTAALTVSFSLVASSFLRLSSSSWISFMVFFVTGGFATLVQTGGAVAVVALGDVPEGGSLGALFRLVCT